MSTAETLSKRHIALKNTLLQRCRGWSASYQAHPRLDGFKTIISITVYVDVDIDTYTSMGAVRHNEC